MSLHEISISKIVGIGKVRQQELSRLGIESIADLLFYFPYRYDHFQLTDMAQVQPDDKVTVKGQIVGEPSVRWVNRKAMVTVRIALDEGVYCQAVWFNQPYIKEKLVYGQTVIVSGKWNERRRQITVSRLVEESLLNRLEPIYSVSSQIKMGWLRKQIYEAFRQYGNQITENLPNEILDRYRLLQRAQAMYWLHFPKNREEWYQARRRVAYEELFLYELRLLWKKKQVQRTHEGIAHIFSDEKIKKWIDQFPFPLTDAQQRVTKEILHDLASPSAMNRLLQGDVGSGKTVVAAIALYANYLSGYQGALMVPTEILADQHRASLEQMLSPLGIQVITLTGRMTAKERREAYAQIEMGLAHIVVGTHALIQETVHFRQLGLVIIDEQHRFGVKQRAKLRKKGQMPDVLCMTATPIPRTLAITYFGDMEVSTIDEMPVGREPITTYWVKKEMWNKVIHFIQKECTKGRQAYVISPLIEESEKLDLQNAEALYEQLTMALSPLRIGLLHGRMHAADKNTIMTAFSQQEIEVLVSTTVVEVGVNVPNATVIVIYDADRFGLAQLHQLRGRVGRGGGASSCILVADPKSESGIERMRVMTETHDGFEISRRDLALRGPGDFLGVKQSGLPEFRVANIEEDQKILEVARADASRLLEHTAWWEEEDYHPLWEWLQKEPISTNPFD